MLLGRRCTCTRELNHGLPRVSVALQRCLPTVCTILCFLAWVCELNVAFRFDQDVLNSGSADLG